LFPHMFFMTRTCVCRVPSGRWRNTRPATWKRRILTQCHFASHLIGSQRLSPITASPPHLQGFREL